jgi:uncharacterized membrane protein YdjX (TVP38/TMEM64 family)
MENKLKLRLKILIGLAVIVAVGAGIYFLEKYHMYHHVTKLINENTPTGLFITLMVFLPLVGVFLGVFLFLLGIKFGLLYGILLLEAIIPVHLLIAYGLAVTLRKPLENFLVNKRNYSIPTIPNDKIILFSSLFLAFPMFPYTVKIYILPMAGVPFRYCFWLNWAIQGTLCIPFVLLGKSAADLNGTLFGITLVIFLVMILVLRWVQRRFTELQKEKPS